MSSFRFLGIGQGKKSVVKVPKHTSTDVAVLVGTASFLKKTLEPLDNSVMYQFVTVRCRMLLSFVPTPNTVKYGYHRQRGSRKTHLYVSRSLF